MTDPNDPKGLIRESYRIDGISDGECRSILMDWALSLAPGTAQQAALRALLVQYGDAPAHPMTALLRAGLDAADTPTRRGGRAARVEERAKP
jgi:hypothetical protein